MSKDEFDDLITGNVYHVEENGDDIIRGEILTIYPSKKYFSDKNNYKIFHSIYVKDMFNMVLSNNRFPSAHENLSHINELYYFVPAIKILTCYYTFIYFYIFRAKYKSAFKGLLYSMIIPLSSYYIIFIFSNAANFYYDEYLRDSVFTNDNDNDDNLVDEKISMYKNYVMEYNSFLFLFNKNQRRLMYTDKQILDYDFKTQTENIYKDQNEKI
jgi:hypothetical protein